MKRPLFLVGIAFALGARTCLAFMSSLWDEMLLLSVAVVATGLLAIVTRWACKGQGKWILSAGVALMALGAGIACSWLSVWRASLPFERAEGMAIVLEGIVEQADYFTGSARYIVLANFPADSSLPDRQRLEVWTFGEREFLQGDYLRGQINLSATGTQRDRMRDLRNEVRGSGTPLRLERVEELRDFRRDRQLLRFRQWLQANINGRLSERSAGIAAAMALGQRDGLSFQDNQALVRSGTAHLLAVSGLHLSVFASFLSAILKKMRLPRLLQSVFAVSGCLGFVVVVGFSASVLRAFLMLAILHLAGAVGRRNDPINTLGFALLTLCIAKPHWLLGQGIWLSFAATLGILTLGDSLSQALKNIHRPIRPWIDKLVNKILSAAGISASAYLFTLPLMLYYNGWMSAIAPFSNVAIAPFTAVALTASLLCAFGGDGWWMAPVAWVADICLNAIIEISSVLADLPFSTLSADQFWMLLWLGFVFVSGVVFVRCRGNGKLRAYWVALWILVFCVGELSSLFANRDRVELVVLEGCDSAVLLREKQAVILGAPGRGDINMLLSYLEFRGINYVAAVIAPELGEQVDSGLLRLYEQMDIGCMIAPDDDYIVEQAARALPGVTVYAGGYARTQALGGVVLVTGRSGGDIHIQVGENAILKLDRDCDIIDPYDGEAAQIYRGGAFWPGTGGVILYEPVGKRLYGETRLVYPLYG